MDATAWQWLQENEKNVNYLLRRATWRAPKDKRDQLIEDLYNDVVLEKLKRIMETYDPWNESGASMSTHIIANLRWYMSKYLKRMNKRAMESFDLTIHDKGEYIDIGHDLRVKEMLSGLNDNEAEIVRLVAIEGYNFVEAGRYFGISKGAARVRYYNAIKILHDSMDL